MEFGAKLSEMRSIGQQKYLLVNVIAKRARMLNEGIRPEIPVPMGNNPMDLTQVAVLEVDQDKLRAEPSERASQMVDIAGIVK